MLFRACPSAQTTKHLIDFNHNRANITKVCFCSASAKILVQCFFKLFFMSNDGIAQSAQLAKAPFHIQSGSCAEKCPLDINYVPYVGSSV